jgi:CheY-like chemotaxis protein
MSRILLVAPDSDLRRSLEFALAAEGHEVTWQASTATHELPSKFDCTVLDHHAVGKDLRGGVAFCEAFRPVILLANFVPHLLSPSAFATIQKPLLGQALLSAIRQAAETRWSTT